MPSDRPPITYPADLPISEYREELLALIDAHQVVIVAGETGSGKSTQLPKLCLELGRGGDGTLIGHTQPRRIAARSVAQRIAEELGSELGSTIGYQVRFTDRVGDETLVKVMTDGILLAEIQRDRDLRRYDTLIIDEAHERSLNIDFLLGYLRRLLPRRPDLKLVITSATIDTERFAAHFGGAPVATVSGRTYPVDVRYRPFGIDPDDDRDQTQAIVDGVAELQAETDGDILVFLSGEREIHDTADALRRLELPHTEILPLYARLSSAEQQRIFHPGTGRRVVLATNVAETSLTVPRVRAVIDAGTARISRYHRRLKVQRLPIEPISQASANQRAGRCGRVAPGICLRLYAEDDFAARPEFTEPEILRTNLASVILQMAAVGLGEIEGFPFVEPPDRRAISDGLATLEELGALDPSRRDARGGPRLTRLGRRLARLPLDPRLARMVLEAERLGCAREVLIVTAALSIVDPRERPTDHREEAVAAHRRFATDDGSDFTTLVRLWDHLRARQRELSSNQFRKLCRAEFLNYLRVREWQDLFSQLRSVAGDLGIRLNSEPCHPDHLHQALLSGLLSQIGLRDGESHDYRGARNASFAIAPGTPLAKRPPKWAMAAELVETNRLWARMVARIQPEWAERLGAHLVRRTYAEPHWDAERGAAMTTEKVLLYGLPIVAARPVQYGRIDPAGARSMFIHHALVEGDWHTHHGFVAANAALRAELAELAVRVRRRDLLRDDHQSLYGFYDRRVGADVTSAGHFERWWKQARRTDPDLLTMRAEDLLDTSAGALRLEDFPLVWSQTLPDGNGAVDLDVSYVFEPGSPDDGVTVHIPIAVLGRLRPDGFEWQVPGLRGELVTALIRTLPKATRRHLVPAAEYAAAVTPGLSPDAGGSLLTQLARGLEKLAPVTIDPTDFDLTRLPDHLRVTFVVVDGGRVVARGKDLGALQDELRGLARISLARAAADLERRGLREWSIGDLPERITTIVGGHEMEGFPALVDDGDSVSVRVFTDRPTQRRAMHAGTRRLLALSLSAPVRSLERSLSNDVRPAVARAGLGSVGELVDDCVVAALDVVIDRHGGPAWTAPGFAALRHAARAELGGTAQRALAAAGRIVLRAARLHNRLDSLIAESLTASVTDARAQLHRLVRPGFVGAAGIDRLGDIARYLDALDRRLDKLPEDPQRDRAKAATALRLEVPYRKLLAQTSPRARTSELLGLRWELEELRVSLFAQQLGTHGSVSEKRLRRTLASLGAPLS